MGRLEQVAIHLLLASYGGLLALSLFNAVLLLWLGLTVLLNAARRRWGILVAGGGAVAGGLFFVSHSFLVMQSATGMHPVTMGWWAAGWLALAGAPLAWYLSVLWYSGYWEERTSFLRRRHRFSVALAIGYALGLLVVAAVSRPIPSNLELVALYFISTPMLHGVPLPVLFYPPFILLCVGLALEALFRPGPAPRVDVGPARRRARPWLITASIALMALCVLAVEILLYLIFYGQGHYLDMLLEQPKLEALWLDLCIGMLITIAVISVSRAVVAYEVFTGQILPRQGLRRQWQGALILAAGYGLAIGAGFALRISPLYLILAAALCLPLGYALVGWRAYLEREQHLRHLRPFVASDRLFDGLLASAPAAAPEAQAAAPFAALCRDVLGARAAQLVPTGALAPLVSAPLTYPDGAAFAVDAEEVLRQCASPEAVSVALDPSACGGALWAVPLWSPRGLIGLLYLGEKRDGGLYAREEMEVARAGGERLLDTVAGAALASRLMVLQRQRLAETRLLDQQSRRTLHDEILPLLHAAMLSLNQLPWDRKQSEEAIVQLADAHKRISALIREMPAGAAPEVRQAGLVAALRHMMATEFADEFAEVTWEVTPAAEARAAAVPEVAGDVLFYAAREAIRNSARHARGGDATRPLHLRIEAHWHAGLHLTIADDGVGSAAPPSVSGGHGLALHSTMLAVVGGSLSQDLRPGAGATVTLFVPEGVWEGMHHRDAEITEEKT
jgi:signal transduction histidine kinase